MSKARLKAPPGPGHRQSGISAITWLGIRPDDRAVVRRPHVRDIDLVVRTDPEDPHPARFDVSINRVRAGIETAAEMLGKLRAALAHVNQAGACRVILADHQPRIGSNMGESALPVIEEALTALGVESWPGIEIATRSWLRTTPWFKIRPRSIAKVDRSPAHRGEAHRVCQQCLTKPLVWGGCGSLGLSTGSRNAGSS
jgi:hypothetical protein